MKMRTVVMAVCMGIAACLFAQGTVSLLPGTNGETSGADGGEMVEVAARGTGTSKVEALKDAYRDAIEKAVGLFVDAEQMVKNGALIKDAILTHSNAYIVKYTEAGEEKSSNGLVTVRILATVKKSALAKKLSDVMPAQTFKLGNDAQNVYAKMVTKGKRDVDAAALLKKTLEGVDPIKQLIRFTLADTKLLVHECNTHYSEKYTGYFYRFKFEVNDEKYNEEFLPMLLATLDQITLEPVKTLHWSLGVASPANEENRNAQRYIEGDKKLLSFGYNLELKSRVNESRGMLCPDGWSGHYCDLIPLSNGSATWWAFNRARAGEFGGAESKMSGLLHFEVEKFNDDFYVLVITKISASGTVVYAKRYRLPNACLAVIKEWQDSFLKKETKYVISLRDKSGEDVFSRSVSFSNVEVFNIILASGAMFPYTGAGRGDSLNDKYSRNKHYGWYVTPLVHTDSKSFQSWIQFDIPADDLSKVATISVELADE